MSCIYFTSREGVAKLKGSEREWLSDIAHRLGSTAWDIDPRDTSDHGVSRALTLMHLAGDDAPDYLQTARAAADTGDHDARRRFLETVLLALDTGGTTVTIDGIGKVRTRDIQLNTALKLGSPQVQMAAKIHGWCEAFAWFDGPDRAWLADLIQDGLDTGIYRGGMNNTLWNVDNQVRWHPQGWDDVQELLRASADGPVVLSDSSTDSFPDPHSSDWEAPQSSSDDEDDDGWDNYWDAWGELDEGVQFDLSMSWLRRERPWAQITPANLATDTFGYGITIYDLYAPDRDDRVRALLTEEEA